MIGKIIYLYINTSFMLILDKEISRTELANIAESLYGDMVKGVVDVDKGLLAIDAELHSDLEGMLLNGGSEQNSLWGINLYPAADDEDLIEFDTLINIRPGHGNSSRYVENPEIREAISRIVFNFIKG